MSAQARKSLRTLLRISVLAVPLFILSLMLWRPALIAQSSSPHLEQQSSANMTQKWAELEDAHQRGEKAEVRFTADEISSALDQPAQLEFNGDRITGQLVSEIQGHKVYVTVRGRLGASDGYIDFQPDEVRIGNMPVPVGLLNGALQKKLQEPATREKLKLPEYISDLRIEGGQLVVQAR